jgi:membrane-bound inhibitor of C-type lysozyme
MRNGLWEKKFLAGLIACAALGWHAAGFAAAQQTPSAAGEPARPTATPGAGNTVRPAIKWKRFDYSCEGGAKIAVYLHNTTAKIRTHEKVYLMRQTSSADGVRYSDGKVLWWGKGDTGFLQEDAPDGDGKILAKGCVLDKPGEAPKP